MICGGIKEGYVHEENDTSSEKMSEFDVRKAFDCVVEFFCNTNTGEEQNILWIGYLLSITIYGLMLLELCDTNSCRKNLKLNKFFKVTNILIWKSTFLLLLFSCYIALNPTFKIPLLEFYDINTGYERFKSWKAQF